MFLRHRTPYTAVRSDVRAEMSVPKSGARGKLICFWFRLFGERTDDLNNTQGIEERTPLQDRGLVRWTICLSGQRSERRTHR